MILCRRPSVAEIFGQVPVGAERRRSLLLGGARRCQYRLSIRMSGWNSR
jgi:hypothetical protein